MAYTVATFTRLDQNTDGSVAMIITHTGSGEIPREQRIPYEATITPTADTVRAFAMDRSGVLNRTKNFITGALPNVGSTLDITTPLPSSPASTFGTFMAATAAFTPGANAQDVFTITGSATRTVQVVRIAFSSIQTTAGMNAWFLVKRSTANSAGTSASVAAVPTNDVFPAATATVLRYTANPTAGTLIGGLWSGFVPAPAPASAVANIEQVIRVGAIGSVGTLTGTTDVIALNFGAAAIPTGLSVLATVWWTEN